MNHQCVCGNDKGTSEKVLCVCGNEMCSACGLTGPKWEEDHMIRCQKCHQAHLEELVANATKCVCGAEQYAVVKVHCPCGQEVCPDCGFIPFSDEEKGGVRCYVCHLNQTKERAQKAVDAGLLDEWKKYQNSVEQMESYRMHFGGTIGSEETMVGQVNVAETIYVECAEYDFAPEELRENPWYWYRLWADGCFADVANGNWTVYVMNGSRLVYPNLSTREMNDAYRTYQEAKRPAREAKIRAMDEEYQRKRPARPARQRN